MCYVFFIKNNNVELTVKYTSNTMLSISGILYVLCTIPVGIFIYNWGPSGIYDVHMPILVPTFNVL